MRNYTEEPAEFFSSNLRYSSLLGKRIGQHVLYTNSPGSDPRISFQLVPGSSESYEFMITPYNNLGHSPNLAPVHDVSLDAGGMLAGINVTDMKVSARFSNLNSSCRENFTYNCSLLRGCMRSWSNNWELSNVWRLAGKKRVSYKYNYKYWSNFALMVAGCICQRFILFYYSYTLAQDFDE